MAKKFYYGGQAVIEGVMMRGRKAAVTTVRLSSGELITDIQTLSPIYTGKLRNIPLLRGVIVLIEATVLGIKTMLFSASMAMKEEDGEEVSSKSIWGIMAIALLMVVALFFVAPLFITRLANDYLQSSILFNLVEGLVRLAIFIIYLKVISSMSDIKRVFAYHGAEHKAVNALEAGEPLEVAAVKKYSTTHVRCGTSFLFAVLVIAIIVFALIGRPALWVMVLSRILLVPVIAALGYEVTYLGARHVKNRLVRMVLAPGLAMQALTTREPDDSQIEVALASLRKAVELDEAPVITASV
ncbi:MAG: DUF1385 domain-containing protein [Dehalococcoidales bacterium]|nr:DUF1385 domain-containing protein [Dehalococcoidales bacterium]